MRKILASKYTSLFCAVLNGFFTISSLIAGAYVWALLGGVFCWYCATNYLKAK